MVFLERSDIIFLMSKNHFSKFNLPLFLLLFLLIFLLVPTMSSAQSLSQKVNFTIDPAYDLAGRKELTATLIKITNRLYFYADENWWNKLDETKKREIDEKIYLLATEFEYKIYPNLTNTFGFEPKPGIDGDERITVLIHPMKKEAGGYIKTDDFYPKILSPKSNEREMFYLNTQYIDQPATKSFLAHEFMHLITFNQKEKLKNLEEKIWLAEAYSEYAISFLGYDQPFEGSNLERRVKDFLRNPSDSLTEWKNEAPDYGLVNLFIQYLSDHYGQEVLIESLKSNKIGIDSINFALKKLGFNSDFAKIFQDWTITLLVNDCALGKNYCYLKENLKNLKITPTIYYLPSRTESVLSTFHNISGWSGNWQKILGGNNNLFLEFDGQEGIPIEVPYLLCEDVGKCQVQFLDLNDKNDGQILISNFQNYISLILIPQVHSTTGGAFSWKVSRKKEIEEDGELKAKLLSRIEELKKEIARVQAQIDAILSKKIGTCTFFENNLYFGMLNNPQVRCLQEFLKSQGPEVYPEGLITGNFLSLTRQAVIRFQEKYADEILKPLNLDKGTGFFGSLTRAKANQLLGF